MKIWESYFLSQIYSKSLKIFLTFYKSLSNMSHITSIEISSDNNSVGVYLKNLWLATSRNKHSFSYTFFFILMEHSPQHKATPLKETNNILACAVLQLRHLARKTCWCKFFLYSYCLELVNSPIVLWRNEILNGHNNCCNIRHASGNVWFIHKFLRFFSLAFFPLLDSEIRSIYKKKLIVPVFLVIFKIIW